MIRIFVSAAVCWVLSVFAIAVADPQAAVKADEAPVGDYASRLKKITIHTASGDRIFKVEIARSEAERARGLMFRKSLPTDGGMLFIYARPDQIAMWMKNTFIPLDMLFIDEGGRIVNIVHNTAPQSLAIIRSGAVVLGVLEIAGGRAKQRGIKVGDQVRSEYFPKK